ncbi:sulfatase [Pseudalgibacter alginicilyticus]|uniref:Sulfatase n=1 Tax=Pseudalgibacter alginicilyticus TaxID=1736674 RepID=A0A0P0CKE9_9FLAO|nr:sulfatase [Pseudalgibacter alginicilyticus]ALJ06747.1 sulfatase [Pseudalgibacter alginicilyticus]
MSKHTQVFTIKIILFATLILSYNCKKIKPTKKTHLTPIKLELPNQPNILWLVTEDMGPYLPPFGDMTVQTPNLSRLASQGVVYPNLYSTAGVCAPSRATIATGLYPSGFGANHMRTTSYTDVTGLPAYEAVPNPEVKMMSELLRMNGYYCSNNSKEDYQFKAPVTAWDESGSYAHWRNRNKNQPFFSVFNFNVTHESGLFEPYGFKKSEFRHYHSGDTTYTVQSGIIKENETQNHLSKNTKFNIPPYLQNTETVRRDLWKMYNNIAEMDKQVGAILDQLEEDGLLESTIIFFYADHGGPLPRQKRLIYDSGLNSPMIIRFPNKQLAGTEDNQLISFVDFAPTTLSLTGTQPKDYMQGQAFLGKNKSQTKRQFIHAAADRFDGFTDAIRAVRDKQFKYIRNYRPNQPYYLPVTFRERIPTMQELLKLRDENKLNDIQSLWFRKTKSNEELYDCKNDPYELNNLINNKAYSEKLQELRDEMDHWLNNIGDTPNLDERELIDKLWKGKKTKPITQQPIITAAHKTISISCNTLGSSIGYKIINDSVPSSWSIYKAPFKVFDGDKILVQAHRIGYKPSDIIEYHVSK